MEEKNLKIEKKKSRAYNLITKTRREILHLTFVIGNFTRNKISRDHFSHIYDCFRGKSKNWTRNFSNTKTSVLILTAYSFYYFLTEFGRSISK